MTNNLNSTDPFGIGRGVHTKTNQIMHGSGRSTKPIPTALVNSHALALSWTNFGTSFELGQAARSMILEKSIRSGEPQQAGKFEYRSTLGKPPSKTACKTGFEVRRPSWKIASSTKHMNVKAKSMRLGKLGMCLYTSSNILTRAVKA